MAELAVFARAHPVDDEASSKKAQRATSEIRQYRVVGHRKSHAERGCFECNLFLKVYFKYAGVAELADALALGASVTDVQVQVLSPAPKRKSRKRLFLFVFFTLHSSLFPNLYLRFSR